MKRRSTVLATIVTSLYGCAGGDGLSREVVDISDPPTFAPVVTLSAEALDAAPRLKLELSFRVQQDAQATSSLTRVSGIGVTRDGAVLVLDHLPMQILRYSPKGRLLRRFGGKGGGPGELQNPSHLIVARDTIYVTDARGVNRFDASGDYIDRFPLTTLLAESGRVVASIFPHSIAYTTSGLLVSFPHFRALGSGPNKIIRDTVRLHLANATTGEMRRLPLSIESADKFVIEMLARPAWLMKDRKHAVAGEILFVGTVSQTSIDASDVHGAPIRRITFAPARREVTDADAAEARERQVAALNWEDPRMTAEGRASAEHRSTLKKEAAIIRRLKEIPRPRFYPVIDRIIPADDGRILVEREDLSTGDGAWVPPIPGPTVWDLIDADGTIHGRVELPSLFTPFLMHDNVIYGTHTDENDIPSIIGLRIIT